MRSIFSHMQIYLTAVLVYVGPLMTFTYFRCDHVFKQADVYSLVSLVS